MQASLQAILERIERLKGEVSDGSLIASLNIGPVLGEVEDNEDLIGGETYSLTLIDSLQTLPSKFWGICNRLKAAMQAVTGKIPSLNNKKYFTASSDSGRVAEEADDQENDIKQEEGDWLSIV